MKIPIMPYIFMETIFVISLFISFRAKRIKTIYINSDLLPAKARRTYNFICNFSFNKCIAINNVIFAFMQLITVSIYPNSKFTTAFVFITYSCVYITTIINCVLIVLYFNRQKLYDNYVAYLQNKYLVDLKLHFTSSALEPMYSIDKLRTIRNKIKQILDLQNAIINKYQQLNIESYREFACIQIQSVVSNGDYQNATVYVNSILTDKQFLIALTNRLQDDATMNNLLNIVIQLSKDQNKINTHVEGEQEIEQLMSNLETQLDVIIKKLAVLTESLIELINAKEEQDTISLFVNGDVEHMNFKQKVKWYNKKKSDL